MGRTGKQDHGLLEAYFIPEGFVMEEPVRQTAGAGSGPMPERTVEDWYRAFGRDRHRTLLQLGFWQRQDWFSPSVDYLHRIAGLLIRRLGQQPDLELLRDEVEVALSEDDLVRLRDQMPFVLGMEHVDDRWLQTLWQGLLEVFREDIRGFEGPVARYFAEHNGHINVVGRVFFHLVESKREGLPFAFLATYSTKPPRSKRAVHTPLKHALGEFEGDDQALLALIGAVVKASEHSAFLSELLESGELFSPLGLTVEEAYTFLSEIPLYEEAGVMCRVPDWWRRKSHSFGLAVTVGDKQPSTVGLEGLLDFAPVLKVGEETVTEEEMRAFLDMADGLMQYKGQWVEVDRKKLASVLAAYDEIRGRADGQTLTLGDAMRLQLETDRWLPGSAGDVDLTITNGQWLRALKDRSDQSSSSGPMEIPETFGARLRAYQERGTNWLTQMDQLGLGACLADDMGLGKTVQLIAFLEARRVRGAGPALLILPASLMGNWQTEIERFAPGMSVQVLHKSGARGAGELSMEDGHHLYMTTYGMVQRLEMLRERTWDVLVLDEAQAIKNPGTKQTKAVKAIPARMRIALTGTPIENRLGDLWSLFDFLNRGLLGTPREFQVFAKRLEADAGGYARLRKMVHPFILRRLKTDKKVIADLPDKLEMNAYTTLSKQQIALYEKLLDQISGKIGDAEGIERKGLVLASIQKFKQICNHPDQYLGREEFRPAHSGKFEQLAQICQTIHEKREKVLVFTQFREMTEPLSDFLTELFGRRGFVLHGGTAVGRRSQMVDAFNRDPAVPYMVLSLKAGGVGLNLTGANHVIHFDRWWNPAVENQATDRAFRIGQTKNVMVHKFVTRGTVEEKIDAMIREKLQLSGDILGSGGEAWITEYSNDQLMELFALGGDRS